MNSTTLVSHNDDRPDFWGVSNRWFAGAGEFVGELSGMATRRADDAVEVGGSGSGLGSALGAAAAAVAAASSAEEFPVAPEGTKVYSAADDDHDDENENENDEKCDGIEGGADGGFGGYDHHHEDDDEGEEDDEDDYEGYGYSDVDTPLFDELSSLGDTPTAFYTVMTRNHILRGAWVITAGFMLVWLVLQLALESSGWYPALKGRHHRDRSKVGIGGGGPIAMFAPRRSKRYARMRDHLVGVSGREALMEEGSPQQRALLYLADGDSLQLVSKRGEMRNPSRTYGLTWLTGAEPRVCASIRFLLAGPSRPQGLGADTAAVRPRRLLLRHRRRAVEVSHVLADGTARVRVALRRLRGRRRRRGGRRRGGRDC